MARRQRIGAQIAGGREQVLELDFAVAGNAGNGRLTVQIAVGELVDHGLAKAAFVVENVMRHVERFGDAACIVDILASAAGALSLRRFPVVVKLQCQANGVIACRLQKRRNHG